MNETAAEMPVYVSHKRVHALKVKAIVAPQRLGGAYTVHFADPAFAPREFETRVFARYIPVPGDYFVVYADGYESFSPAKAFEDGYRRKAEFHPLAAT